MQYNNMHQKGNIQKEIPWPRDIFHNFPVVNQSQLSSPWHQHLASKLAKRSSCIANTIQKLSSPKSGPKDEPKQTKSIGPVCNPVTTYPLRSSASKIHISLVPTPNHEPFTVLDSWIPKLQNHMIIVSRNSKEEAPILSQIEHCCAAMDLKKK